MKDQFFDVAELDAIRSALRTVRAELRDDLARVRQLPKPEIARMLRESTRASQVRADALVHRITELRLVIDSRRRTLERLRARMRQLRGGMRPH